MLLVLQTEAEVWAAPGASTKSEAAVNKINEVGSLFRGLAPSLGGGTERKKNRRFLRIPSCDSPLSIHGPLLSFTKEYSYMVSFLKGYDRTLKLST